MVAEWSKVQSQIQLAELLQVWRHFTAQLVPTQEEIPEEEGL